jgi:hypothetical protein
MKDENDERPENHEPEAPEPPKWKRDPGMLKRAFERSTSSIADGKRKTIPHRRLTFRVDHTICEPDVFDDDFELTVESLTAAAELEASRAAKGDPVTMAVMMARRSVFALNGVPIDRSRGEDEWLWNVLGTAGRNLVMSMFVHVGTPGEAAMGKAAGTLRIH